MRQWINSTCKFCNKDLGDSWMPECDCPGWQAAEAERQAEWDEEHKDDPPEEDYDKVYPQVYHKEYISQWAKEEKDQTKLALEVRKFKDGFGCCIFFPWWDEKEGEWSGSGLCWDFCAEDIETMRRLLREAQAAIKEFKKEE